MQINIVATQEEKVQLALNILQSEQGQPLLLSTCAKCADVPVEENLAPTHAPKNKWPKRKNGVWVDAEGTRFDPNLHQAMKCKANGCWKMKPGRRTAPSTQETSATQEAAPEATQEAAPEATQEAAPEATQEAAPETSVKHHFPGGPSRRPDPFSRGNAA